MKKYNEMYVIGIDHGYGNMKTANCCFPTGVMKSDTEDAFLRRAIQTIQQVADEAVPLAYRQSFMESLNSPTSLPEHTGETEDTVLDFLDNFS